MHQERPRVIWIFLDDVSPLQEGLHLIHDLGCILTDTIVRWWWLLGLYVLIDRLNNLPIGWWRTNNPIRLHVLLHILTHHENVDVLVCSPQLPIFFRLDDVVVLAVEPILHHSHGEWLHFSRKYLDQWFTLQKRRKNNIALEDWWV